MAERSLNDVPKAVLAILAGALALQISLKMADPLVPPAASDLRAPPGQSSLQLASLGDPIPLAKVLMLYLQSFDYQALNRIPYQNLNYDTVQNWLLRILWLDPGGQYPLLAASRLYAEVPNEGKARQMLEFVYEQFAADPNRQRGEFVLIVTGAQAEKRDGLPAEAERVLRLLLAELPLKQSAALAAAITGARKNKLYERALALRDGQ